MPRKKRIQSSTGIYHIVMRGINRQIIFEDDEDYRLFLEILAEQGEISLLEIYSYCLMSNHIHLLLKQGQEDLSTVFKRIGAKYVYWYNRKYNRQGHLFQDRFKSEVVQDDPYFLAVLRYIHQNPIKAGITKDLCDYPWSSYPEYINGPNLCTLDQAFNYFSSDRQMALTLFQDFHQNMAKIDCLEWDQRKVLNDQEAMALITELSGIKDPMSIQTLEKQRRNAILSQCREKGLSIRQLQRLTGVSFGVIRRL